MSNDPEIASLIAAAKANDGQAQYDLGLAYFNGDGIQQDFAEAYFWLTVCTDTKGVFWSPSPIELAAEASLNIGSEAALADAVDRAVVWLAQYGPPTIEH